MITGDFVNGLHLMVGLSTDTKPDTTSENTFFLEEDTGDVYYFSEGEWAEAGAAVAGIVAALLNKGALPAVTSADNGKVLGVDDGVWTPVEGGGGSGLIVVGINYSGGTYSTDTSSSDIYAAWSAGYVVKARDNLGIEYDLQNITSSTATFFGVVDQSNALGAYTFTITGTTVTRITHSAPVAPIPSASDNGKFLTVSGGAYALVTIPAAESEAF